MKTYYLIYWLPKQSKLFSDPQMFTTTERKELEKAIETAEKSGYEIEEYGEIKERTKKEA